MMFCDQDDVWHPDKVEKTMRALLEAEDEAGTDTPVLVFTDLTPVDEKLRPIASSLMKMQKQYTDVIDYRALFMQNIVTGCATASTGAGPAGRAVHGHFAGDHATTGGWVWWRRDLEGLYTWMKAPCFIVSTAGTAWGRRTSLAFLIL